MSEGQPELIQLIDRAHTIAQRESRLKLAHLLNLAAHAAIAEKPAPLVRETTRPFKRRQWRWSTRGWLTR
jgi:hypothetical protein